MSSEKRKQELLEVNESETFQNYEYSVKIMRRLLQSIGIWPIISPRYPIFLRVFAIAAMFFLLAILMITVGLYTFLIVKDFKSRARQIGPLSFCFMNVLKFVILLRRENDLRECLIWLSNDWRNTKIRIENNLMLASAKTGVTFTIICASFMLISGMAYSSGFSFIQQRTIVNNVSLKAFAYPGYFVFFDAYDHFYKIYFVQSMCGLAAFTTTAAGASVAIALTMHVCGQISVISYMLQNLASGTFDKAVFRYIVKKHLRALELAKKVENSLSGMCLVEMTGCCFNICTTGYNTIMEFNFRNPGPYTFFLLMVSFAFNVFAFCYVGEQLSAQCSNIGNMVYNVDWYRLSPSDARSLLLIMSSTQRPVVLTSGKMAVLSMRTFSNVLKAAISYMNMLRTLST